MANRGRLTRSAVVAIAVGLAPTAVMVPVHAATAPKDAHGCPQGDVCFWSGSDYHGGEDDEAAQNAPNDACKDLAATEHSADNDTNRKVTVFEGHGCKGKSAALSPGSAAHTNDAASNQYGIRTDLPEFDSYEMLKG